MKKLLMIISILMIFTACGNKDNFQYHSKTEKEKYIKEMIKMQKKNGTNGTILWIKLLMAVAM